MRNLQWVIVGIGVITGAFFLLNSLLNADLSVVFNMLIILLLVINVAAGVGYLTNRILFQRIGYNPHIAILAPWASVFAVLFVISALQGQPIDWMVTVPITLVFGSVGGAFGYSKEAVKMLGLFHVNNVF